MGAVDRSNEDSTGVFVDGVMHQVVCLLLAWGDSLTEAVDRLGGIAEKLAVLDALSKKVK